MSETLVIKYLLVIGCLSVSIFGFYQGYKMDNLSDKIPLYIMSGIMFYQFIWILKLKVKK